MINEINEMNEIELEIDGKQHGFHEVWVHLQDVRHQESVAYRISVAANNVRQVFDPYSTKGPENSWTNFIEMMVAEFGTFIVEGFVDNISVIAGEQEKSYLWVIATVDKAVETDKWHRPDWPGGSIRALGLKNCDPKFIARSMTLRDEFLPKPESYSLAFRIGRL